MNCTLEYVAAGGNRHSSAADWAASLLAYGAGNNIALWNPEDRRQNGITSLLKGHTGVVNAVRIYERDMQQSIISGGADHTIRIWSATTDAAVGFRQTQCLTEHTNSINAISVLSQAGVFVSGAADATVKIWQLQNTSAKLLQSISLKPRFLPLTLATTLLSSGETVLAVAGTCNFVQLYMLPTSADSFELQATLSGHEGWIRSLDFTQESRETESDVLLASASQDKYIRLWRFHRGPQAAKVEIDPATNLSSISEKKSLSNKAHQVGSSQSIYSVTFEALLIGHEDWIYTVRWQPVKGSNTLPSLLSASADNSLAIWHADPATGLWVCDSRLGEISSQKGSTTATGSTGGFWIGLWHSEAHSVASLGRTGSWRKWTFDSARDMWLQQVGIGGHVQEVVGLAWSPQGDYLLSTSSDQTTRMLGEWKRSGVSSWHEVSRPQIHGYDLNCIDTTSATQFVSGADEKALRVFNKPRAVDALLSRLGGLPSSESLELPDAANIPVLGLSNKAMDTTDDEEHANGLANGHSDEIGDGDLNPLSQKPTIDLEHPPFEDHLARHTLWPEHEKLYGHGYEISTVTTSNDGSLIATACKASSIDHAVIRLYQTQGWREVKPPLKAHSLTVTSLSFSPDDRFLLSVGRDRQWALFKRDAENHNTYVSHEVNPKGHSRMILDCSWAPLSVGDVFATAGRDKSVKIWRVSLESTVCLSTITATASVTAVAFKPYHRSGSVSLTYGTEEGNIVVVSLGAQTLEVENCLEFSVESTPSKTVNALKWRPRPHALLAEGSADREKLAAASDDGSVRIYNLS